VREWLYVDDCVCGIIAIMRKGKIGRIYNLGSACESRNIDTVRLLLKTLGVSPDRFEFVKDRLGHDLRYSLDSKKAIREVGWKPEIKFVEGLELTVGWSVTHQAWLKSKLKDINKLYK
jgi:dTDP-glucose 4,6-dehydratase